jgi:hypothetical protein
MLAGMLAQHQLCGRTAAVGRDQIVKSAFGANTVIKESAAGLLVG